MIDYDQLRNQALEVGRDEAVTVNTRALIDKVLARYSGAWTTLRELLQNAADASSRQVCIRLETTASSNVPIPTDPNPSAQLRHVLLHHTLKSTTVENDGVCFQTTDWERLKKIAEGNPDETKIGAFGVGFYSVFAECEEPFVSSGKQALAFYWKGDALFTKKLTLNADQNDNTIFFLPSRSKDASIPNLLSLSKFLVSSLIFVGLESIKLHLNDIQVLHIVKKSAPALPLPIPSSINTSTKDGFMQIVESHRIAVQIDAHWTNAVFWTPNAEPFSGKTPASGKSSANSHALISFFSRLAPGNAHSAKTAQLAKDEQERQAELSANLLSSSHATLFVHVDRSRVKTRINASFAAELERSTKKPPPRYTTISLLSSSLDERNASSLVNNTHAALLFDSFMAGDGKGRIFIGFTTNQTTALGAHLSMPSVIPTVERESIDLVNRFVKSWNIELLRAAGIVSRIGWTADIAAFAMKLSQAAKQHDSQAGSEEEINRLLPAVLSLHNQFPFSETTPSPEVGRLIEEAFWTCDMKEPLNILSTQGFFPASSVRIRDEDLTFAPRIPYLLPALNETTLIRRLVEYGIITETTISDIKNELTSRALDSVQMQRFIAWIIYKLQKQTLDVASARSIMSSVIANYDDGGTDKLLVLENITTLINPARIPADMPVPPYVLPFIFSKGVDRSALSVLFDELQLVPWLRWLLGSNDGLKTLPAEQRMTESPKFSASVLAVISKNWESLSQSSKASAFEILANKTTIPTKLGMRRPADSYFASVRLFDDLPNIVNIQAVKEKVLVALGVRKTIEISLVLDRLVNSEGTESIAKQATSKWDHIDLIRYLASVRNDIPSGDICRLRETRLWPAEAAEGAEKGTKHKYLITELFQPDSSLRQLRLVTLQWPGTFRPESNEGRFLLSLGLRAYPQYQDVIDIVSKSHKQKDFSLQELALQYLVTKAHTNHYANFSHAQISTPFLPIQGSEAELAIPSQVYTNERCSILSFPALRRDLLIHAPKFGVAQNPPLAECIERLVRSPPRTHGEAREVFGYMATRVADIQAQESQILSKAKIVPITLHEKGSLSDTNPSKVKYREPSICFLGDRQSRYSEIFDYVDFGTEANAFLLRVGSKHEPSITELAQRVLEEPAATFAALGDSRYLDLLRALADHWSLLKKDKLLIKALRLSKCLLAYQEINTRTPSSSAMDDEGDSCVKSWQLVAAKDIVVVDDIIVFNHFKENLLAAPMEANLEGMYHGLGSIEVSKLLVVHQSIGQLCSDQHQAENLCKLLLERSRLFLHDHASESVKHDTQWLQKRLAVQSVQHISVTMVLEGYSVRRKLSRRAAIFNEKPILYITQDFDMLEVSQAIAPLLLQRVKPHNIFMLEMMLESSLSKLRSRGYNVQRILNEKAREARIAEDTRRAHEEEEAQQLRQQREAQRHLQNETREYDQRPRPETMPGLFPESPESPEQTPVPQDTKSSLNLQAKPKGFLSGLSKQFGLDRKPHAKSIEHQPTMPLLPSANADGGRRKPGVTASPPEAVTSPSEVEQNLVRAVKASRPHHANHLRNKQTYNNVKETSTYCDAQHAQNITCIGECANLRVFLANEVLSKGMGGDRFLDANGSAFKSFALVLKACGSSFALETETLHIFYDDAGATIAFNINGALFFNYRYFENLHLAAAQLGETGEATIYWSIVLAHELAHNLVGDHSSAHSYWTETLIMRYFPKIAQTASQRPRS